MSNTLIVNNIEIRYANTVVIESCSFSLEQGRILSLLGASGCGKSTLLKAIAGLLPLSAGKIYLNDALIASSKESLAPQRRGIGMIFQDYALFPHLTVMDNVMFGLRKQKKSIRQQKAKDALALVKLSDYAKRYPHELSGGQQQRVAIARALVCEPKVLLFDEPFSNLDTEIRHTLINEIKQLLKARDMSAIFVTHDKTEAFSLADDIAVLDKGKIIQIGEPQTLYQHPANRYIAELLGHGVVLSAQKTANAWQTELGHIPLDKTEHFTIWQDDKNVNQASIFLRPQQINLLPDDNGNSYISARIFFGDYYHYTLTLKTQAIQLTHPHSLAIGQTLRAEINVNAQ